MPGKLERNTLFGPLGPPLAKALAEHTDREMTACPYLGTLRYTWPGRDEANVCIDHAHQIKWVADGMGMPIQFQIAIERGPCTSASKLAEPDEVTECQHDEAHP